MGLLSRGARSALAMLLTLPASCADPPAERSPETVAVEEQVGDFLDYYEEVLRLARRYGAHPDSFRTGLAELPGSHLSEDEWDAWTEPYRDDPSRLAGRLEEVLAELTSR